MHRESLRGYTGGYMRNKRGIVIAGALAGVVWFFPSQGSLAQKGQSHHVTVLRELGHDMSPPLAEIPLP
jgi:hypothetical protein